MTHIVFLFQAPAQSTDSKTVCCCCCESDPITATLKIDRCAYVPGECVTISAEIDDKTGRGVNKSEIELVMVGDLFLLLGIVLMHKDSCFVDECKT